MSAYIEFRDVKKVYKMGEVNIEALSGVDFSIDKGEFVVVAGASGAGKSTILNILGGMDSSTSGQIIVDNNEINKYSNKELITYRRYDIGFVFQFYNLVPNLTIEDNILLPLLMDGKKIKNYKEDLNNILDLVGLKDKRKMTPRELSGGQQQRVAIARALLFKPEIILADEPIGNLDSKTGESIMELFRDINKKFGTTIVQVTHAESSAYYGDSILRLLDGEIVSKESIENVG